MTRPASPDEPCVVRPLPLLPGIPLSRPYPSQRGQPIIDRIDEAIFTLRYFGECMKCDFCHDSCCQFGMDCDLDNIDRLAAHAEALTARTGVQAADWFKPGLILDADFPGGKIRRSAVRGSGCVFRNHQGRGCHIHSYCLETGLDYHDLKPSVCWLFPLTVDRGLLHPNEEVRDASLACTGPGPTLYQSQRSELLHYFGPALVAELDEQERRFLPPEPPLAATASPGATAQRVRLGVVDR